ncbi:hypothetical protein [Streptomyces catenulae]|uniref:ATP-binding protein n=1 Tax=Streptomyces catenulae TaxID=66875 RepID=A0ABV2YTW6_9ACTN|nr:hypothetical protein [Streptomyces catenulae]
MKQATLKTLGTALLGMAFTATAAGSASAIDVGQLGGALHKLPVKQTADTVSGVSKSARSATGDIRTAPNAKGNHLLGGLPTAALGKALPLGG